MQSISTFAAVFLLSASAYTQTPNLEPKTPHDMRFPTITYEFVRPGESSARHVLSVDSAGNAAYRSESSNHAEQSLAGEPRILKFTVPQSACRRIFELARQAHYFKEKSSAPAPLDPTFAKTSTSFTTLTYSYGPTYSYNKAANSERNSITVTKTADPVIQELASILQKMADSLNRSTPAEGAPALLEHTGKPPGPTK